MSWIRTIAPEDADGRLAEAYSDRVHPAGQPRCRGGARAIDALSGQRERPLAPERSARPADQLLTSILNATPHCASLARTQLCATEEGAALIRALDRQDYAPLALPDAALAASSMRFARSTTSAACSAAMSSGRSSGAVVTGPIIPHRRGRGLLNHRVSQSVAAPDQVKGAGSQPAASGRQVRTGFLQSIPSSM